MKRFIFSVCALAAVVVGCTKSEVINRPHAEEPIQFNPYTGRIPVTKGTASDIDTLGKFGFQVYAFMYPTGSQVDYSVTPYMNKVVTNTDGTGWTYSGNAYWPGSNLLNFIAYGLNTGDLVETTEQEHIINYTVPVTVADQKDLLVAKYQSAMKYDAENENGTVNFVFSHLLSRVGFSLVTKKNNAIKVSVEQVDMVGDFYSTGQVNLADAKATSIKIGDTEYNQNRPYITPTGTAASTTYSLLPVSDDYTSSFTSVGAETGAPIYDNSMLWVKDYGQEDGADDDEYKANEEATEADEAQAELNKENRYMMIIPVEGSVHKAVLKVKYFLPGAGTFTSDDVDLSSVNFEPGKSYDFKLKVSTNGISFDVTVEDWDVTGENREVIELN